jgi:carboxylesterase
MGSRDLRTIISWMDCQGPEHEAFLWPGGQAAALLVHGFPDTAAKMRPLGQVLKEAGWTVQGLLLPGFGPQIETLPERRWQEWKAAVVAGVRDLKRAHAPVLLAGYSLGGVLSLGAAAEEPPDGLVLLAPFVWPTPWWLAMPAWLLRPFPSLTFRPLRRVDFADPRTAKELRGLFPLAPWDDPATEDRVRRSAIPLTLLDQVRRASQDGYNRAAGLLVPVLIVQGRQDDVALPERTRLLLSRLHSVRYEEVEADHQVMSAQSTAWPKVRQAVAEFAGSLASG